MFMFGMRCVRCDHEIIAPRDTELLDDRVIRHVWHCPSCKARFESFPRFPKGVSEKGPKVLIAKGHHRRVGNAFGRHIGLIAGHQSLRSLGQMMMPWTR
jgi:hypothetical protein